MITIAQLAAWIELFAPKSLAESWDNVGLLWGDPSSSTNKIMTCLTVTSKVAEEAIAKQVGAIVSHHPVLFRAVKSIRADQHETRDLWSLARANIAILSPHTAFDNTFGGINDLIAKRLGLTDVRALKDGPPSRRFKIVTFIPKEHRTQVLEAAFAAGAGQIGDYNECSFTTKGSGTFFGNESSHPSVGEAGRRETVQEYRVEMVCPAESLNHVFQAIRATHPYEEPATDVYPLQDGPSTGPGVGRVGNLGVPQTLRSLCHRVGRELQSTSLQFVGSGECLIKRLAIVCGAGDDFLKDALKAGADALLTGEARFHRGLEAEALGIGLIVAGHHATERPGVEELARRIGIEFPSVQAWPSEAETDPFQIIA
jgi:dinuclear metal center YbgI/SA1388 family protein